MKQRIGTCNLCGGAVTSYSFGSCGGGRGGGGGEVIGYEINGFRTKDGTLHPYPRGAGGGSGLGQVREWVGLTDEDVQSLEYQYLMSGVEFEGENGYWAVYRAIETKLREKNT